MIKRYLLLLGFLSCSLFSFAQKTHTVKGIVEDTLGNALISSTVLLLERSDSTLVKFTRTELDGSFAFRKVPMGKYLVKTTYVGYIPLTVNATSPDGKDVNLGTLKMTELAAELMEVVIKAAKAPIKMNGDTIEYDASTFQVPEGSSVEELLKQLPGIEVDTDGSILADGQSVDRVTVDGKKFFGSDPKAATKNLPAEGISKVQVFDTKSEEEKITGSTAPADSKTMNLELKDEFKNGGFGRVTGGVGTESRAELKGNYNKFNEKIQLSLVGVGNNTGRNGLAWDDYQDFMGSSAFNFSSDGDYGFGGGGGRMFFTFGGNGGNSIENSIQNVFFSGRDNGGFPENYNGGINFNYNHKKTEFSSVYYYNQAGLSRNSSVNRRSFFPAYTLINENESVLYDISRGHRAEISLDQEIDSFHSVRIEMNGALINQDNNNDATIGLSRDDQLTSSTVFDNDLNTTGNLLNGIVFFRKKFKKKARRFGANFSYLNTNLLEAGNQNSTTSFYNDQEEIDSTSAIQQATLNDQTKVVYKTNAVYVEPLSKNFFSQTFYNFSSRQETGDKEVRDELTDGNPLDANLSRTYDNTIQLNRVGTSIRYSKNGTNISLGAAYQQFDLFGEYASKVDPDLSGVVDRKFVNWIPNFSMNFQPKRGTRYSMSYTVNATEPSIENLQPIVDNSNPLRIFEGNSDLTPEISHGISGRFSKNYALSGIRINLNANYNIFTNQIIQNETVDDNLITYIQPINYEGNSDSYGLFANFNFPIVKNKLKARLSLSGNRRQSFAFVNEILNETINLNVRPSVNLTYTPKKKTSIELRSSWNVNNATYSINETQNQQTLNTNYAVTANSLLYKGFYLNSSFNYSVFTNDRFGFDQSVPILNASIYKLFLKGNKAEARLSIYDALNMNRNISQFAGGNSLTESQTTALGRYVMLSLTYNIKGVKDGIGGGRWH